MSYIHELLIFQTPDIVGNFICRTKTSSGPRNLSYGTQLVNGEMEDLKLNCLLVKHKDMKRVDLSRYLYYTTIQSHN